MWFLAEVRRTRGKGRSMAPSNSFTDLMARLRAGEEPAAADLFHRFAQRLIALARSRLDQRLRQKVDPEDVLQSVYQSFFLRHTQRQFELASWDDLWSLLTVLTLRKCSRWARYFHTAGRDVARETSLEVLADTPDPDRGLLAAEPTPEEAAVLTENVEQLFRGLEERDRAIVSLSLQGYSVREIGACLGRPQRTIFRVLERVKQRMLRLQAAEGESQ
jgi:RNA polymerase sigma-70 factor (ECF subfamily)